MGYRFDVYARGSSVERVEPVQATVTGFIPPFVEGDYYFNSNGVSKIGNAEYVHLFDSLPVLIKISVSSSGCSYQTRHLQCKTLARNKAAGTIAVGEFATPAVRPKAKDMIGKLMNAYDFTSNLTDSTATNIKELNGKLYTLGQVSLFHEIDRKTLETIGKYDLKKEVGLETLSPHIKYVNDSAYLMGLTFGASGAKLSIAQINSHDDKAKVVSSISARWRFTASTLTDYTFTTNYALIFEQPVFISITELFKSIINSQPIINLLNWCPDEMVQLTVIDTSTWKAKRRFNFEAQNVLMVVNAYEKNNGDIVIDFISYKDLEHVEFFHYCHLKNAKDEEAVRRALTLTLRRLVIPMSSNEQDTLSSTLLFDHQLSHPCINENFTNRPYRYCYGMSHTTHDFGEIHKVDVKTGISLKFSEPGLYYSSIRFIPAPSRMSEDDGIVAAYVLSSQNEHQGYMLYLDAQTLTEVGRVAFTSPDSVLWTNGGVFLPHITNS